jgi:hypothetical protein
MTSAVGILLLFAGGIGLHSTYQTGLVLAGLALLGTEAHGEEASSPRHPCRRHRPTCKDGARDGRAGAPDRCSRGPPLRPPEPSPRISQSECQPSASVKDQVTPERLASPGTRHSPVGPPGTRTPNLRIKSLVQTRTSELCRASEPCVRVSVLPIDSRCFPFHRGDETGGAAVP